MGADPDVLAKLDSASWINDQAYFGAYTEVDKQKILAALKKLKLKPKILIEPGSLENPDTNVLSPIKSFKGYTR
jgi:hypothetical protein